MKRVWLGHTMVEYLHEPPDPKPVPLNTFVLVAMGFVRKGSVYSKGDASVTYDGCDWWKDGSRCNTVQELENMMI